MRLTNWFGYHYQPLVLDSTFNSSPQTLLSVFLTVNLFGQVTFFIYSKLFVHIFYYVFKVYKLSLFYL